MQGLTFSMSNPRPSSWKRDGLLFIQGSIQNTTIHRLDTNIGSSADIIYDHCFYLLLDRWKEGLKPATGQLTGFKEHNVWPLGTIHLPFTLFRHDKSISKMAVIDFVVIWHPAEHNTVFGRTARFKCEAIPSTIHRVLNFSTTNSIGTIIATSPK